jgi:hypothetical protein
VYADQNAKYNYKDVSTANYKINEAAFSFYSKYVDHKAGTYKISQIKKDNWITKNDLGKDYPDLVVDVGGEGSFTFSGVTAGYDNAINLNGRIVNSQNKLPIPMLLQVTDWNNDRFPFDTETVKIFYMDGCGLPTCHTTIEMLRCIRKDKGSKISFYLDAESKCSFCEMFHDLMSKVFNGTVSMLSANHPDGHDMYRVTFLYEGSASNDL